MGGNEREMQMAKNFSAHHLFVKDRSGKLHSLPASTARRLRQELIDNCAQQRLVQLAEMVRRVRRQGRRGAS